MILAIWTPIGLLRPTRMQYGWLNAGIIAQGAVRVMIENDLTVHAKEHSLQAADDFSGFSEDSDIDGTMQPDWDKLADDFIEHLDMALKNNMSLKAGKTVFGSDQCMFFGYILDKDGQRAAEHNLSPIEKMVAPRDKSELRRVLGLCIQHKDAVPGYKRIAKPLFKLTGNVPYEWTEECNDAFEQLRHELMKNNILAKPDWTKRFYCATDASEDGWGYVIYQLKDVSKPDVRENRAVLKYASNAWSNSLRNRPPYYQEGFCFVEACADARYYSEASPFPLAMRTDHKPLKWMKTCSKGPLNMWRVSKIGDMDYDIEHRNGKDNNDADSVSRHPRLGARSLVRIGSDIAVEELLKSLPPHHKTTEKWWVWAGRDTTDMSKLVQAYKDERSTIYNRAPKESFNNPAWRFAVLLPRVENATSTARQAIDDGRPACILMPTELVYYTAQEQDESFNEKYIQAVKSARKITLMATDSTWLCINSGIVANDVRSAETQTKPPGPTKGWTPAVGTLSEWKKEQPESMLAETEIDKSTIRKDGSGLILIEESDGLSRVYVPNKRRGPLMKMHHEGIHHLAANKTYISLHRHFEWPGARRDVRAYYKTCSFCKLSKATRNVANKMSRAVESRPPRSRFGMDYYGVGDGEVLGVIDLDSLYVCLFWHLHRSAELCLRSIRDGILFTHGRFESLRSDHAREFIGRIMSGLKQEVGFSFTTTGGYNATGNSTIERFWRYLGMALRALTDAQYANAKDWIQSMAFAWNTTSSESLQVSPFEVYTGTQARTVADGFLSTHVSSKPIPISSITSAAAEFTRLARANADFTRATTADVLNKHGRRLKQLVKGDYVKIYAPPSHKEAVDRRRKQKHIVQWRGPMLIEEKMSNTCFRLSDHFKPNTTYERNLTNMRPWVGPIPTAPPQPNAQCMEQSIGDIEVGDLVLSTLR